MHARRPIAELATLLNGFPFEGDIVLELGRSIAADCGTYLTSVVDAKTTSGQNYAIIDVACTRFRITGTRWL